MVVFKPSNLAPKMSQEYLGHILRKQGHIDQQKLEFCLNIQKNNGGERIGRVLRYYDFTSEDQITAALANQAGWEVYQGDFAPHAELVDQLGLSFIQEHLILPVVIPQDVVFVCMRADNLAAIDLIQSKIKADARFMLASETRLRKAIEQLNLKQLCPGNDLEHKFPQWVDQCLMQAVAQGATDIHFETSQKAVEIRFRIDGLLYFIDSLKLSLLPRLINIFFHKAEVAISDFNHCHDARFTFMCLNRTVDVRVSHIPTVHGSSLVLRLLDKSKAAIPLMSLGYGAKQWELIQKSLSKPEGITLLVGPTGCGKTTTLYAMLNHLKSISRKIVTIEDPVEIVLPLMTQVQTNEKRGISFSHAVRAFLRHDPNIILIGEIRDKETAQEAMRAAMTGHKVFATLHANRPMDAILRLNDLGVPFTHMAGNLSMIITQRLVRCLSEGSYKGRTVIAEVLSIDDAMSMLIGQGQMMELRKYIQEDRNYITLAQDMQRLIADGITDERESIRVLG